MGSCYNGTVSLGLFMSEKKAEKSENSPKIPDVVLESPDAHGAKKLWQG